MTAFEENEISINSFGGTELSKRAIAGLIPADLANNFQVIASRVRELEEDKIRIYWLHDLPEDPEASHLKDKSSRDRFHKLVFVSHQQMNDFVTKLGIPMSDQLAVIENPIKPLQLLPKPTDQINLIYFSTPQRGLELLVPVFDALSKKHDNIHLNVYSSFQIYGWKEMDEKFEPLYQQIREHPKMTYHGFVEQETLRTAVEQSHILAYPSIWKETSCRVLIESMSAGLMCVHPNLGALADTAGGMTSMYQFTEDRKKHAELFYQYLDNAIQVVNTEQAQKFLSFIKVYTDSRYHVEKIGSHWETMLRELVEKYPDADSRKIQVGPMFTYKIG